MNPRTLPRWAKLCPTLLLLSVGCDRERSLPVDGEEEQRALRALLDDGPLTNMPGADVQAQALSIAADAGAPTPGGRDAGSAGGSFAVDGGTGGIGGSPAFDGGFGGVVGMGGRGGAVGTGGSGGFGPPPDGGFGGKGGSPPSLGPAGFWRFDDCNSSRTDLFDSAFFNHTAFRSVGVACVPGAVGQGVQIRSRTDYVYVPDQPDYTFGRGVTIAAWVDPATLGGARTILRKREGDSSAFVLLANDRDLQFVISLDTGRAASLKVKLPTRSDGFFHVAATYDGEVMRLYLGGEQVAAGRVRGTIGSERGPILVGNDASGRLFEGVVDEVWFDTQAQPPERIAQLACRRRAPAISVTPAVADPVAADVPVTFQVGVTSQDDLVCAPTSYQFFANAFLPGFTIDPQFTFTPPVAPGTTATLPVTVTASDDVDPGRTTIPFSVSSFDGFNGVSANGELVFQLAAGGCRISTRRELMITSVGVVDDPVRTGFSADPSDPRRGAWTFARLMRNLAPTPDQAPDVTLRLFQTWLSDQVVNDGVVAARPAMGPVVLDSWPRTADGRLDLERAPLRLAAIVNRPDLRQPAAGNAGEGRFVFNVVSPFGFPLQFNVILEYKLPAATEDEQRAWFDAWHALGNFEPGTEEYNAALQALTDRFTARNAAPGQPNGSALSSLRTNEIELSFIWELRQFSIGADGFMQLVPLDLTPRRELNGGDVLARFVDANRDAVRAGTHTVPATFEGQPFQAGSVTNDLGGWSFPDTQFDPLARQQLSINTCNGCHSANETNTFFTQINPRFPGSEASLSPFLTGTTVFDPIAGVPVTLNDLARRRTDLKTLVCPSTPSAGPTARAAVRAPITAGIARVH